MLCVKFSHGPWGVRCKVTTRRSTTHLCQWTFISSQTQHPYACFWMYACILFGWRPIQSVYYIGHGFEAKQENNALAMNLLPSNHFCSTSWPLPIQREAGRELFFVSTYYSTTRLGLSTNFPQNTISNLYKKDISFSWWWTKAIVFLRVERKPLVLRDHENYFYDEHININNFPRFRRTNKWTQSFLNNIIIECFQWATRTPYPLFLL